MTVPSCDDKRALRLIAAEAPDAWHGIVGASPVLVDLIHRKLLRVLQERELDPLGAEHTVPIDVRVVAASLNEAPR